jgi:HEAT repeat protein
MDSRRSILLIATYLVGWFAGTAKGADDPTERDRRILGQAGLQTDAPSLLKYLEKQTGVDDDLVHVNDLIPRLGSKLFAERDEASKKLIGLGAAALSFLRRAQDDDDKEIARRAKTCAEAIERNRNVAATVAAVRLLTHGDAKGVEEMLLRYVPYAGDPNIEEEIWFGIDALVVRRGALPAPFEAALKDPLPSRRALAGYLVARRGKSEARERVHPLLGDSDDDVRLRSAQGLLAVGDKAGVPALIGLLDAPSIELAWQAEELLHWAAGDDAPDPTFGTGAPEERKRCRKAWVEWWKRQAPKLDLGAVLKGPTRPGLCLVAAGRTDVKTRKNESVVWVCGCDGKARWSLNLAFQDLRWLPGARILLAHDVNVVTERDLTGKVLWRYEATDPIRKGDAIKVCQRLLNGNTFIGSQGWAVEVNPQGEETFAWPLGSRPGLDRAAFPQKLDDGRFLCQRLDKGQDLTALVEAETDKVRVINADSASIVRTVPLPEKFYFDYKVEPLPSGHFLIAGQTQKTVLTNDKTQRHVYRVSEVDGGGKAVWDYVIFARHATRVRNGNTLAACCNRLIEIDSTGKLVWEALSSDQVALVRTITEVVRLGFDSQRPAEFDIASSVAYRLKGLRSKDVLVRRLSAQFLAELGPKAVPAGLALVEAMDDPDELVRRIAANTLSTLGSQAIPFLLEAMNDTRLNRRLEAIWALGQLEKAAKPAVPALIEKLKDDNTLIRRRAAWAIGRVGPEATEAVPALAAALKDTDSGKPEEGKVAIFAAIALGNIGPAAKDAVPALAEALITKDAALRERAVDSLGRIGAGSKAAAETLAGILMDGTADISARRLIPNALARIGVKSKPVIAALKKAMADPDKDISSEAVKALKALQQ